MRQRPLNLTGGAYEARSLIANAQRCVNLYPEGNPPDSPFPFTYYPTPGLVAWSAPPVAPGVGRGIFAASNGILFAAVGNVVYRVDSNKAWTPLLSLTTTQGMVSMQDNGSVLCVVDGSTAGFIVDLTTYSTTQILNPSFYGSTFVRYLDTYFIFNRPNTNQFYISNSNLIYSSVSQGPISAGALTTPGSGLQNGTYTNVALTGGTGTGAIATVTVAGGAATALTVTNAGDGYTAADTLSGVIPGAGGVLTKTLKFAGQWLSPGTFTNVPLTGGHGSGALATVVVTAQALPIGYTASFPLGIVTSVTITTAGSGYSVNDSLTTSGLTGAPPTAGPGEDPPGPVRQASITVNTVTGTSVPFVYTVSTILSSAALNSLDIASKTGYPDPIVGHIVVHREIWFLGTETAEVWQNTGAPDFTFGILPGVFIEHGCLAPYSIAATDLQPFWLGRDKQGRAVVYTGLNYQAKRISTHAIENAIQQYTTLTDAIGYTYQQGGHYFYVLNFPSGNATWVYDLATEQWHERISQDMDGTFGRALPNSYASVYQSDIVQDYATGQLYVMDLNTYTDNGADVPRIRSYPHIKVNGVRMSYACFVADMDCGQALGTTPTDPPQVSMRYSDDGGNSWSSSLTQSLGAGGEYNTQVKWWRLGLARDRVFEVSWSLPYKTALQGAYVAAVECKT